jgi:hypothetical protein
MLDKKDTIAIVQNIAITNRVKLLEVKTMSDHNGIQGEELRQQTNILQEQQRNGSKTSVKISLQ